jgi:cytoskeletal protein RodZ
MKKWMKGTAVLSLLFVLFSLVGCGSNEQTTKETNKKVKTVQVKKQTEQENKEEVKVEPSSEQNKPTDSSTVVSEEKKENQSTSPTSTPKQTSPSNQQQTPTSKTNTAVTTNKSSTPTTTAQTPTSTTPASKTSTTATPKPATTVTLSIVGPKDRGTIVAATKVSFNDGDTIYDIILAAAKKHGIVIDSRGSGATAYIEGIDNIYEFDYGPKSGWVFEQNGISLTKSIGVTKIKDGDRIECIYTE